MDCVLLLLLMSIEKSKKNSGILLKILKIRSILSCILEMIRSGRGGWKTPPRPLQFCGEICSQKISIAIMLPVWDNRKIIPPTKKREWGSSEEKTHKLPVVVSWNAACWEGEIEARGSTRNIRIDQRLITRPFGSPLGYWAVVRKKIN